MKVKIISVRMDETFRAIHVGPASTALDGSEYLEHMIQSFLNEHPDIEIVNVQSSSGAVVPTNAPWRTTNTPIEWEIEQTVIVFYRDGP